MKNSPPPPPTGLAPKQRRATRNILLLYFFFASMWGFGYAWGLYEQTPQLLIGLPIWFLLSCLISFALLLPILYFTIRRDFV